MPPFIHPWSVVDVLKHHAVSSTHEQLDGILTAFIRDEFGKRKVAPACVFPLPGPQPPNHRTISPTRHLVLCLKIPRSYGLHAAQLEAELLRVAGHRACRRAIGTLRPQIKEIILRRHEKPLARRKPLAKHEPLANKPLAKPPGSLFAPHRCGPGQPRGLCSQRLTKGEGAGGSGRDRQAADMADTPCGARNVEVYEKVEQVGEGTYGCDDTRRNANSRLL